MRKLLFILTLTMSVFQLYAQDTTFVQTYTWDSISTRRATFQFPQELEDKSFEKVLMYYNLKCDPATPWDSYNCGEWDYLAYTRIFEHTGLLDSVQVDGRSFLMNFADPASQDYSLVTVPYAPNTQEYVQNRRTDNTGLTNYSVLSGAATSAYPLNSTQSQGQHYQFMLTAAELLAAGVTPGDIQSLSLSGVLTGDANFSGLTINTKFTTATEITAFTATGLTEVYNAKRGAGMTDDAPLVSGNNEFIFYQPITWNGTDNLILDFKHADYGNTGADFMTNADVSVANLAVGYPRNNGVLNTAVDNYAMSELSNVDFGNEITISFWSKGNMSEGTSTSIIEGYDTGNNRVVNIHFPWSNNRMYWDAGEATGYDRIDEAISSNEIDNTWNNWAFTKNAATGEMFIYKNGTVWHSGTDLNLPVGKVERFIIGANKELINGWNGKIDELQIWDKALDQATISAWYNKAVDNTHPDFADLVLYHNFDDVPYATDASANNNHLMPSEKGMFDFSELPVAGFEVSGVRPNISLGQGTVAGAMLTETNTSYVSSEPNVFFEFTPEDHRFDISNTFIGRIENQFDYDANGAVLNETTITLDQTISNGDIIYYEEPFEEVNDIEIGRFITPYGIGFDLGPNGFTWVYDVTDYQQFLKGAVDLAAHNTQELIDLKFVFVEGTPPRDVHNMERIYGQWKSFNYGDLDNDVSLPAVDVALSDTSSMFRFKSRITGHGHEGNQNCCEWDPKDHKILVDGVQRYSWSIWQENECGDNPNIGQGGTWPYAREGWCPGDLVDDKNLELTPFVTPGTTVSLDYDITPVSPSNPGAAGGNYVMASHLISYGAPNFQRDAAVVDVLNPNGWEYYSKWNPTCSNPKVIIQNTGELPLTSARIKVWIAYGQYQEFVWNGNLEFLEKEIVEIPITDNSWWGNYEGELTFSAQIYNINGGEVADDYGNNDVYTTKFVAPETIDGPFFAWFRTNNKANENSYKLVDASGAVLYERTNLENTTEYKDTFDLDPGCYALIIEDSDDDGIGFWYSGQVEGETTGFFRVREVGGSIVETFPTDFGSYHRYDFSIGFSLGLDELKEQTIFDLFPNPTNGTFEVSLDGNVGDEGEIMVYNMQGKLLVQRDISFINDAGSEVIDLSGYSSGMYIVKVVTDTKVLTKEIIKK